MNKATYLSKLDVVKEKLDDSRPITDLKAQAKAKKELERFWKKGALTWMEKNEWHKSYKDFVAGWHDVEVKFDLKPTGSVTVTEFAYADMTGPIRGRTVTIPKKELLS